MGKRIRKTHIVTAAQGIQGPHQARMYGRDSRRGKPNVPLIENLERYSAIHDADLKIVALPGSYVNEIELDPFFHDRDDVYIKAASKRRNEAQKETEQKRRDAWRIRKDKARKAGREFTLPMPMHYFWHRIPETDYKVIRGHDKRLNSNIHVQMNTPIPQNKNPLRGKSEYTKEYGGNSFIMGATKQVLEPVASGQAGDYPRLMIASGACTHPSYNTSNNEGQTAYEQHEFGFGVADVLSNKLYLPRLVPALKNGVFVDQGIKFSPGKDPEKARTIAMTLGDLHVKHIDKKVDAANHEMMEWFQPAHTFVGDSLDGDTVNRHEHEDSVRRMNKMLAGDASLEEELVVTRENLVYKAHLAAEWGGEMCQVWDNHALFLYDWLAKGRYKSDPLNAKVAHKLLGLNEPITKGNILEKALGLYGDLPENLTFLEPGEDRIYWGVQFAAHGHLGKNGARGTLKTLIESYGRVAMGHVHQLEVRRGSGSAGTSSQIPLDYQLGTPSTSMAGNLVLYDNGLLQALPIVQGRWAKSDFADCLEKKVTE